MKCGIGFMRCNGGEADFVLGLNKAGLRDKIWLKISK